MDDNKEKYPIRFIDAKQFYKSNVKVNSLDSTPDTKPRRDEFKLYMDLNSVLVKFWRENVISDTALKIRLLERMLNWYREMGTITLDDFTLTD